ENSRGNDVLTVSSKVELDVWDLEALGELKTGCWLLTVAGGIRHADLVEFYDAVKRNTADTAGVDVRTLQSSHRFTGTGPTTPLEARRLFGDSGLALYSNLRASVLFGTRRQVAFATVSEVIPEFKAGPDLGHSSLQKEDVLPVTEAEVGIAWCKN